MPELQGIRTAVGDASARIERAALISEKNGSALGDLQVTMTSQTSAIATSTGKIERAVVGRGKLLSADEVRCIVSEELAKVAFATPDSVAARVTGEFNRRFATLCEQLSHVENDTDHSRNDLRFMREVVVRHAQFAKASELARRKRQKGGSACTAMLISTAAIAAAPYMRPPVVITFEDPRPVDTLFQHQDTADRFAAQISGEMSPLTAQSPEYEPGEIAEPSASASGSGGV
ncbi:hypothetical protein AURDEDRAFT_178561 [Auricularia subglabra TFB-10046 SS5]|uniref:Uncharacterized protein n=1 Tax=Auricularia subglabra (strain TFB-10046 / SS5) TaxID=717982 RepID=J0CQ91_AURST|nr:hypothetical protein AURDEDRAFT_178561 [Auricularia subglabra TFB-10046 SS5]